VHNRTQKGISNEGIINRTMTSNFVAPKLSTPAMNIHVYDSANGEVVSWGSIQNVIKNKFKRTKVIQKIDEAGEKRKQLEKLISKDAFHYFDRAEPIEHKLCKIVDFINRKIYIKDKEIFKNDMFWLNKGIESTRIQDAECAIDYYKQALKLNPMNFEAAFNIAFEYQKQDSISIAKSWYEYCTQLNKTSPMSHCGVAL